MWDIGVRSSVKNFRPRSKGMIARLRFSPACPLQRAALVTCFVLLAANASAAAKPHTKDLPRNHHSTVSAKPLNARPIAAKPKSAQSPFAQEAGMNAPKLIERWKPIIDQASKRMGMPADWIRAVVLVESGGRTMMAENKPITSSMGAMGLMQLMPDTWREMQQIYRLGNDPYDPHDNIMAGAAYLRSLYWEYGYPGLFAAYNDGPGMIEAHRRLAQLLPPATAQYMLDIAAILRGGSPTSPRASRMLGLAGHPFLEQAPAQQTATTPQSLSRQDDDDDYYHEN